MKKIICVLTSIHEYRDKVITIFEQRVGLTNIHLWQSKVFDAFVEWLPAFIDNCSNDKICLVVEDLTVATYLASIKLNKISTQKIENLPDVDVEFFEYFDEGLKSVMDEDGFLDDNYMVKQQKKAMDCFYAVVRNYIQG